MFDLPHTLSRMPNSGRQSPSTESARHTFFRRILNASIRSHHLILEITRYGSRMAREGLLLITFGPGSNSMYRTLRPEFIDVDLNDGELYRSAESSGQNNPGVLSA